MSQLIGYVMPCAVLACALTLHRKILKEYNTMSQKVSHQEIMEALQGTAHKYGAKMMAAEIGKAPSTFYAEINPYQYRSSDDDKPRHKLGLEDAMLIMQVSGDYAALHLMCAAHGFEARPVGAEPVEVGRAYAELGRVVEEVGGFARELVQGLEDDHLTHAERVALFEKVKRIRQALAPFLAVA